MSTFHVSIDIVSRSTGRSSVGAAAYRAGEKLTNDRDGITHDYTRKGGVVYSEIMLPENTPIQYSERAYLWNDIEKIENRKDAQTAREIEVALPRELNPQEQANMLREYIQENFVSRGMIADFSIHKGHPHKQKNEYLQDAMIDSKNPHAHIMLTMRSLDKEGKWEPKAKFVYELDKNGNKQYDPKKQKYKGRPEKTNDWDKKENAEIWRESWARIYNREMEKKNIPDRVDHRSYKRQGIDREPTIHKGAAAHQMELRGIRTERGDINRAIENRNRGYAKTIIEVREDVAAYTADGVTLLPYAREDLAAYGIEIPVGAQEKTILTYKEPRENPLGFEDIQEKEDALRRASVRPAETAPFIQPYPDEAPAPVAPEVEAIRNCDMEPFDQVAAIEKEIAKVEGYHDTVSKRIEYNQTLTPKERRGAIARRQGLEYRLAVMRDDLKQVKTEAIPQYTPEQWEAAQWHERQRDKNTRHQGRSRDIPASEKSHSSISVQIKNHVEKKRELKKEEFTREIKKVPVIDGNVTQMDYLEEAKCKVDVKNKLSQLRQERIEAANREKALSEVQEKKPLPPAKMQVRGDVENARGVEIPFYTRVTIEMSRCERIDNIYGMARSLSTIRQENIQSYGELDRKIEKNKQEKINNANQIKALEVAKSRAEENARLLETYERNLYCQREIENAGRFQKKKLEKKYEYQLGEVSRSREGLRREGIDPQKLTAAYQREYVKDIESEKSQLQNKQREIIVKTSALEESRDMMNQLFQDRGLDHEMRQKMQKWELKHYRHRGRER